MDLHPEETHLSGGEEDREQGEQDFKIRRTVTQVRVLLRLFCGLYIYLDSRSNNVLLEIGFAAVIYKGALK